MQIFDLNVSESLIHKVVLAVVMYLIYRLFKHLIGKTIVALANTKQAHASRTAFILRSVNIALLFVFASLYLIATGVGYGDVSLFLSSIFAVLGVALVAQWSILSNITASFLIFFVFPYRVGDFIKVVEKDEDVRGKIIDITMFHVLIQHESGIVITYPNNLILQKGVLKLSEAPAKTKSKSRLYTRIGK